MEEPKMSLLEMGTRWSHYSELRELFACGVEILKNITIKSPTDRDKLKKLEGAVELLDGRINLLADFHFNTTYGSKLRGVVDGEIDNIYRKNKRENELRVEGAKVLERLKETNEKAKSDDDGESPADYSTK
jgi:4-hydroxy-3-methylbut-2-en-1-yl diphosphate synthase IspG/GcpE